jgi:N-carbamoylputrescine amidase
MACSRDERANIAQTETLIRQAKEEGADLILLQELFATPYFCQAQITSF